MRSNPSPRGWVCRSADGAGPTGVRPVRPAAGPDPAPSVHPDRSASTIRPTGNAVGQAAGGSAARPCPGAGGAAEGGAVRVRFTPSEVPVLTCCPAGRTAALRGAAEALARMGRSYLGGNLEVTASGPHRPAVADERLAAARAVENVLRGGCGSVQVPPPRRWPAVAGCTGASGCPCPTTT